ncbi:hypothetical protein LguiB_004326 [Lonicera macranthoides]
MVKEIRERGIVEHLFNEVVMTVVSQNQDLRKIQDQLASTLKFNINEKGNTYERGIELSKRLAQGRILIIFDDIWEELDFGELGIPIRGEAVGAVLKDRDKCAWEDALKQLKMSAPTSIEGMDIKVHSVLRLSYNYLERNQLFSRKKGSNEIQQLFLLCCLFPKDYDIPIECLVRYVWGLRQFRNINNLAAARNRTKSMAGRLTSSF